MALSPALHPLNIFRPAKVKTILRLVEPLGLGSGLADLATLGFCAVALSVSTIRAGNKELSAMEALARRRRVHGEATTPAYRQDALKLWLARHPEQKPKPKKNFFVLKMDEENTRNPEEDHAT